MSWGSAAPPPHTFVMLLFIVTPWTLRVCWGLLGSFPADGLSRCVMCCQADIIDDVQEFVAAADVLKDRGAYKIYIMATHGLLSAEAPRQIEESPIDEVRPVPA